MTKYLLILIAALSLALGGALLWGRHEAIRAGEATLQATQAQAQADALAGRLDRTIKATQAAKAKQQAAEEELRNALKNNPEWDRGAVPDDVARSLCRYARCAPAGAGSVPSPAH